MTLGPLTGSTDVFVKWTKGTIPTLTRTPRVLNALMLAIQPPTATLLFTSDTEIPQKMVCALRELPSNTQCAVRSGDDLWVIKAKDGTGDVSLEKIRFDLDCNLAGHTS